MWWTSTRGVPTLMRFRLQHPYMGAVFSRTTVSKKADLSRVFWCWATSIAAGVTVRWCVYRASRNRLRIRRARLP